MPVFAACQSACVFLPPATSTSVRSRYQLVRSDSHSELSEGEEGKQASEGTQADALADADWEPAVIAGSPKTRESYASAQAPAISPLHPTQSGASRQRSERELEEEAEREHGCCLTCIRTCCGRRRPYDPLHPAASDPSLSFDPRLVQHSVMDLFRSEDMKYVAITMTNDSAHATVRELGKMNKMHVIDVRQHTTTNGSTKQHSVCAAHSRTPLRLFRIV